MRSSSTTPRSRPGSRRRCRGGWCSHPRQRSRHPRSRKRPAGAPPAAAKPAAKPAANPAPSPSYTATLPVPIAGIDYWVIRNAENLTALLADTKPNVLFLGDSITDRLANGPGKPLWTDTYAPLGARLRGERPDHLERALAGRDGAGGRGEAKVVVLLIGSNNLGLGQKPQEVTAGVAKIVNEIEAQLPDARILLLGILPRGAATDPLRPRSPKPIG